MWIVVHFIVQLLDRVTDGIMIAFSVLLLTYGGFCLWENQRIYQQAGEAQYEIYRPDEKENLGYEKLKQINPDVIAWLKVDGTQIDYPVVQGKDNRLYVTTDVMGEYSVAGSLFLDCRNLRNFSDVVSIIYGHHMAEHAMFGDVGFFEEETYFQEHKTGNLFFDEKNHPITFFAFLEVNAYDQEIYAPSLEKERQEEYIQTLKRQAKYWRDPCLNNEEHLLLLSTCAAGVTDGRYLLIGKIQGIREKKGEGNETEKKME